MAKEQWMHIRYVGADSTPWLYRAISLLLIVASGAKVISSASPGPAQGGPDSLIYHALPYFEAFLAAWLLLPVLRRAQWWAVTVTFAIFMVVSASRSFASVPSCGCFGEARVPPALVTITDLSVLICLAYAGWLDSEGAAGRVMAVLPLLMAILVCAVVVGYSLPGKRPGDRSSVLDTNGWVGKPFPLRAVTIESDGSELLQGIWTILLYHNDCDACAVEMQRFMLLQQRSRTGRFAAIEIPPFGSGEPPKRSGDVLFLKLRDDRAWFVNTPKVVYVRDGFVVDVSDHVIVETSGLAQGAL